LASVYLYSGTPNVIKAKEEGTAGGFKKGDLTQFHSDGHVRIAVANETFSSIAMNDATGVDLTPMDIDLLSVDNIYVAKYKNAATSEALIGDCLDFTMTAGSHTLDEGGATTDVYCVGLHPEDGAKTGGRLLVRFYSTLFVADN